MGIKYSMSAGFDPILENMLPNQQGSILCIENAKALKEMSIYMLIVLIECAVGLGALVITSYYQLYTFSTVAIFIAMVISVTLAVVCAALSHLVHKASMLQEEHDLTV